jgi:FeS assembly SUF system protein
MTTANELTLTERIIRELKLIYDPEIPVDIYELGLIYDVFINKDKNAVKIIMTLTTPNCPVAESMPQEVKDRVKAIPGIDEVVLDLTFEPPWNQDLMSDEAKLALGFM